MSGDKILRGLREVRADAKLRSALKEAGSRLHAAAGLLPEGWQREKVEAWAAEATRIAFPKPKSHTPSGGKE